MSLGCCIVESLCIHLVDTFYDSLNTFSCLRVCVLIDNVPRALCVCLNLRVVLVYPCGFMDYNIHTTTKKKAMDEFVDPCVLIRNKEEEERNKIWEKKMGLLRKKKAMDVNSHGRRSMGNFVILQLLRLSGAKLSIQVFFANRMLRR